MSPAVLMRLATGAALLAAFVLVGVKTWAYLATGSVALLSSLADSAVDLIASGLNFLAVRYALSPADEQHRFGHGKAEPLSGLAQAAFVAGSAVLILVESVSRLHEPAQIVAAGLGMAVTVFSLVITAGLVAFQRYVIARTASVAVSADSLHYAGDILLNLSVLAALYLTQMGIAWADPAFGIGISIFMAVNAARIVKVSINVLMDHELPTETRGRILEIASRTPGVKQVHELRTRSSGVQTFIQMHVVLDGALSLTEAHRISDGVEAAVAAAFPGADILIHADPAGIKEYHAPVGTTVKQS